jgi:hypothetical protein
MSTPLGRFITVFIALAVTATPVSAQSGQTAWGPWQFRFEVKDGAGLALRDVRFRERYIGYKFSMPVIRVRYAGDECGPYDDRIDWGAVHDVPWCGNAKICQRSYTSGGRNWLEIGILAHIGQYRLYQAWYLSDDGWIQPHLWSKGLQCHLDHEHHTYWRLDFDIDYAASDQAFVFDNNRPNEGWGPGWHEHDKELDSVKNPPTDRKWFVRDAVTSRGCWLLPGMHDGTADSFSTKDYAARLYHAIEDVGWMFGAWGHLGYLNGENIRRRDVVVWYVAHLHHEASHGGDQWHGMGPWIKVHQP